MLSAEVVFRQSSNTPRRYAQASNARQVNSVPLSTVMDRDLPWRSIARSRASATAGPDILRATSRFAGLPSLNDAITHLLQGCFAQSRTNRVPRLETAGGT